MHGVPAAAALGALTGCLYGSHQVLSLYGGERTASATNLSSGQLEREWAHAINEHMVFDVDKGQDPSHTYDW